MVPATLLCIGAEETQLAVGPAGEPNATLVLAIGSIKTAREYFKHHPPTPVEIENAIAAVEDEVARARAIVPPGSALFTAGAVLREVAALAGIGESAAELSVSLEALEHLFERLAAQRLPGTAALAASVLILREFMHHLQFTSVRAP